MKLLLFSDIHLNEKFCKHIVDLSHNVDIVIGAGDYCSLRRNLDRVIGWLSIITKPTLLVPGNAESYEELVNACQGWSTSHVLHGNGTQVHGILFFGIGGGIPVTPFGSWSYDFSEIEAENLLKNCPRDAILISHSPPKGIKINLGDPQDIRILLLMKAPHLVKTDHALMNNKYLLAN